MAFEGTASLRWPSETSAELSVPIFYVAVRAVKEVESSMQQMEWGVFPGETEEEYLGAAWRCLQRL